LRAENKHSGWSKYHPGAPQKGENKERSNGKIIIENVQAVVAVETNKLSSKGAIGSKHFANVIDEPNTEGRAMS